MAEIPDALIKQAAQAAAGDCGAIAFPPCAHEKEDR